MAWTIEFDAAAVKDLQALDPQVARRLIAFMRQRVATLDDPRAIGQALTGSRLGELWKYRVGDWRILASIEDERVRVLVVEVGHRREIYR